MLLSQKLRHILIPTLYQLPDRISLPNKQVRLIFELDYAKARKVKWSKIDAFRWQVFFEYIKSKHWVIYTNDAVRLETTVSVSLKNVPSKIQEHLELRNKMIDVQHVYKIKTAIKTIFEVQLLDGISKKQLVYDENGKLLGEMIIEC